MALTVGELTAIIRADDAGFRSGLSAAALRLRGLQRDADGRLRDINGRFVRTGDSAGRGLGAGIARGARAAVSALGKIAPALAGIGVGLPVAAAAATALGGIAAGAAAAGLAVKAFQLAAGPQMDAVTETTSAAEKAEAAHEKATLKKAQAQKLAAKGGDKYKAALREAESATKAAKDADAEYEQQLAGLPPATRRYAKSLAGLKDDHQEWSDELSKDTMPVFTKGIELARDLLPTLTPFVRAAASAIGEFLDDVSRGVKSAGFKQWAADMSEAAGPALSNFLTVIKNLAVGIGGLLQAFLPRSGQMTGGLVSMSEAFAQWGQGLKDSEGFARFLDLASAGGGTLGQLALAVVNLLIALGPLIGISTQVALALASVINALPPDVLSTLTTGIVAVVIAMKAYRAGAAASATISAVLRSAAMTTALAWVRGAAMMTAAMLRIAATATLSAARTAAVWAASAVRMTVTFLASMIRTAAVTAAHFTMMAVRAVAWAAVMAASWIAAMGPVGWITMAVIALAALIIANWSTVKRWTAAVWTWVWEKVRAAARLMVQAFLNFTLPGLIIKHWSTIRSKTAAAWNAIIAWLRGVPGRIRSALYVMGNFVNAVATGAWRRFSSATRQMTGTVISYVRGIPGRIRSALGSVGSLLYNKGQDIVSGLWRGIRSMGSWLRSTLINWAKDMIPGPIAKALGINSPSTVMAREVGRWIPPGVVKGVDASKRVLDRAMAKLVTPPAVPFGAGGAGAYGARGGTTAGGRQTVRVVLDVAGADSDMKRMVRRMVRVDGRGSVQTAFA